MTTPPTRSDMVTLKHGAGGKSMGRLIDSFREQFTHHGKWKGFRSDSAFIKLGERYLCFTTDSHIVTPLLFPGGNIGTLAVNGTINDIAVMGADPLGLSLSFVIEEGFQKEMLDTIVESIARESEKNAVPVVTGDTKVMGKGELDKLVVNTSAVGMAGRILDLPLDEGDLILASGELGNHEATLIAKRFNYEIDVESDCASVLPELREVRQYLKFAKDPTRGGLNSTLHEIAGHYKAGIVVNEESLPFREEVKNLADILGLYPLNFASEGRFICGVSPGNAEHVLKILRKHNRHACIIGEVKSLGKTGLILETTFGALKRVREFDGDANPRIC